ncbi:GntR family transcriptional regulator [Glutamicibacter uratoxydans]|uniref:GntR family transcriptional regulator n=1 Tax=Glutamicibacter uratoxydans TaxID=43667 RepID=A0A4Y4DKT4_GLUUR|nr:FCD domain-containing protein [Glutamicibacter uratoxydans]GED05919.1 GntR family transcriptional regulator [Glutamicibacter uratoxydans]
MGVITRRSVVDEAIDLMRERISSGQWSLGMRLPSELELSTELGLSRAALREAVRALVHAGLLGIKRGDGTFVTAIDERAIALRRGIANTSEREVIETRQALDIPAAALAAQRRTDDDLKAMEAALARRRNAAAAGDLEDFRSADHDFHRAVFAATHNELLIMLHRTLTESIDADWVTPVGVVRAAISESDDHDEIYRAILEEDPQRAVASVSSILDRHEHDLNIVESEVHPEN